MLNFSGRCLIIIYSLTITLIIIHCLAIFSNELFNILLNMGANNYFEVVAQLDVENS